MPLSEKETQFAEAIAGAVKAQLTATNPGFVSQALCDDRFRTITTLIKGLYYLVAGVFLAMVGGLITRVVKG